MKKLLFFVVLLSTITSFSQHKVGLEMGVSSSMFRDNFDAENFSKRLTGFTFGIFHEYQFSTKWSLKSLISSQKKGYVVDDPSIVDVYDPFNPGDGFFEETAFEYNFVIINPLLKFTTGSDVQFFANIGPYYGFQTKGRIGTDIGVSSGIGGQYILKELTFSLEARNSLGLNKVFEYGNSKTNTYYLLTGIAYNL